MSKNISSVQEIDFEKLVAAYRKTQDPELFQQLYEGSYRPIYQYIYSLGHNEKMTEEAIQNGYIICYEKLDQLAEGMKFVPWLKTICYREYLALLKKQNKTLSTDLQDEDGEDKENNVLVDTEVMRMPEEAAAQEELKIILLNAINALPDGQRIAVMRFYYDDVPVKSIAEELGVPENTIKSYLSRGRRTMGKKIGSYANAYGLKLVPIATVPFIASLFKTEVEASGITVAGEAARASYAAFVSAEAGKHAAASSAGQVAGSAGAKMAGSATRTAAEGAVKSAAGAGAKSAAIKVAAGVTAAAVAGGGTAAVLKYQNSQKQEENVAETVTETAVTDPYQAYKDLMKQIPDGSEDDEKLGFYRLYDVDGNGIMELFVSDDTATKFKNSSGEDVWTSHVWTAYTIENEELKTLGEFSGLRTNNDLLEQSRNLISDYIPYAETPVLVSDKDGGFVEYLYQDGVLTETYEMIFPSNEGASNGTVMDAEGNQILTMDTWSLRYNGYTEIGAIDRDKFYNILDYHYQDFLNYLDEKETKTPISNE